MTESKSWQGSLLGDTGQRKLVRAGWDLRATWREAEKACALQRGGAQEQTGSFTGPGIKWARRSRPSFSQWSPDRERRYNGVLGSVAAPGPPCCVARFQCSRTVMGSVQAVVGTKGLLTRPAVIREVSPGEVLAQLRLELPEGRRKE